MKFMYFKKNLRSIIVIGIAFFVFLIAFAPALFSGKTLYPPVDGKGNYPPDYQQQVWESLSGKWSEGAFGASQVAVALSPSRVLAVLLPPLTYHLLGYVFDVVLLCLAGFYYVRGRGVKLLPSLSAALALGVMGYSFSLISAGHRGVFDMMPCGIFILGLIDRAVGKGSLIHYALIGPCVAFGLSAQPDIMVMFLGLGATYAVYRFVSNVKASSKSPTRCMLRVVMGGVVCLLFFGLFATATVRRIRDVVLPGREAQINSSSQVAAAANKQNSDEKKKSDWIFATNWSLPSKEIVEFVAPCVYGIETGDRSGPYWGRLGRSFGWDKHHQGLMNLRQHTVYMGGIQLAFAALAVALLFRRRKNIMNVDDESTVPRGDLIFWFVVFVVTVMLALGRNFPLYRLFYSIPYCSKIRAPVKFLHLSGAALAFLFAFGVDYFMQSISRIDGSEESRPTPKVLSYVGWGTVAFALVFLVASAVVSGGDAVMEARLRPLGFQSFAPLLTRQMSAALARGGLLLGVAGALMLMGRLWGRNIWLSRVAIAVFVILVPLDLALVGQRYVRVRDVEPIYHKNPIAKWLEQDGTPMPRLSYHLAQPTGADWRFANLYCNGMRVLVPGEGFVPSDELKAFYGAFSNNMPRLWQLSNTRYILGPTQGLETLVKHPDFERSAYISLAGSRYRASATQPAEASLVRYNNALPRAQFYHSWQVMPQEDMLPVLANTKWDPSIQVLVVGESLSLDGAGGITLADVKQYSRRKIVVKGSLPTEGILLLNDQHDEKWRVTVDGEVAELLRCNYLMRGVKVPAGSHVVEFVYQTDVMPLLLSLSGVFVLLAWGMLLVVRRNRRISVRH